MHKFLLVIVSKDDKIKLDQKSIQEAKDQFANDIEFAIVLNNSKSLAEVYNSYLTAVREDAKQQTYDFVAYMHADVNLNVVSMINHVVECADKYDAFGLCGCAKISVSQSPLNWFCGSRPYPESRWGCVTHGEIGNHMSYFSQHSPNVLDHQVACIDGLCMILGKKVIQSDFMFDEQFAYDFYDTDFSFQCNIIHKFKLGVIVQKDLQHYSVGKSILTDDFLKHEIDFRRKWNLEIPKDSRLHQLILADPQLLA